MVADLGTALHERFAATGHLSDLSESIPLHTSAVTVFSTRPGDRAGCQTNLSIALLAHYQSGGDTSELDAAVHHASDAVASDLNGHPERQNHLTALANALHVRCEHRRQLQDGDAVVDLRRRAVDTLPPGDPRRPILLDNLANAEIQRFRWTGASKSLAASVAHSGQAVTESGPSHPAWAEVLASHAEKLNTYADRADDSVRVQAVAFARDALRAIPEGHPRAPKILSNIGVILKEYASGSGSPEALDEAVTCLKRAVSGFSQDDPEAFPAIANLGNAYRDRFLRGGNPADIDHAVELGRLAVERSRESHVGSVQAIIGLVYSLRIRHGETRRVADLQEALALVRTAATANSVPTLLQAAAQRERASLAATDGNWQEVFQACESLLVAVHRMAPIGWLRADQEYALGLLPMVGSDGAAAALQIDDATAAVGLCDAGCGVLHGQVLDTRVDLSELAISAPEVYERLQNPRVRLSTLPST